MTQKSSVKIKTRKKRTMPVTEQFSLNIFFGAEATLRVLLLYYLS